LRSPRNARIDFSQQARGQPISRIVRRYVEYAYHIHAAGQP